MALIILTIDGEICSPRGFTFDELQREPDQLREASELFAPNDVRAMPLGALIAPLGVKSGARLAIVRGGDGYVANIPLESLNECVLCYALGDLPLSSELGGPVRLIAPRLGRYAHVNAVTSISLATVGAPMRPREPEYVSSLPRR
jgi:DMSO/TMAO reductase YedYZ molybdopterin-dependent catalytic subunit